MRLASLCMLVVLPLAGCLGAGPGTEPGPAGEVPVVRQPGVEDPETLVVDVVDPTAEPDRTIAGARVVFFTKVAGDGQNPWRYGDLEGRCEVLELDEDPFRVLAVGRTGPLGRVVGLVEPSEIPPETAPERPINVAIMGVANHTTEAYLETPRDVPAGCDLFPADLTERSDDTLHVVAPVYPTTTPFEVRADVGPAVAAPAGPAGPRWFPEPIYGSGAPGGALSRLRHVDATLTWSNGPGGSADLYLGLGSRDGGPTVTGSDRLQGPADRDNVEVLDTDVGPMDVRFAPAIGPVTNQPVLTADGISYRINGTLHFEGARVDVVSDR